MDVEYVLILAINKTIYYSQEGELTAGVKTESWGGITETRLRRGEEEIDGEEGLVRTGEQKKRSGRASWSPSFSPGLKVETCKGWLQGRLGSGERCGGVVRIGGSSWRKRMDVLKEQKMLKATTQSYVKAEGVTTGLIDEHLSRLDSIRTEEENVCSVRWDEHRMLLVQGGSLKVERIGKEGRGIKLSGEMVEKEQK